MSVLVHTFSLSSTCDLSTNALIISIIIWSYSSVKDTSRTISDTFTISDANKTVKKLSVQCKCLLKKWNKVEFL